MTLPAADHPVPGSASIATGVFLTYLVPETLLFLPLFKMFAEFNEYSGIEFAAVHLPNADGSHHGAPKGAVA